jgi:hypothetical protein
MAALTRSGARKASEIVILIFLTLQFSRLAMVPAVIAGSAISSSSQRRPRVAAPSCGYLLPRDLQCAWWLGEMDDQPVRLGLNAQDVSMDEALVVDGLREFEMPVDCRSLGANCRGFVARFFDKRRCV